MNENKKKAYIELNKIKEKCNHIDWDGYDSDPVTEKIYEKAKRFINLLPDDVFLENHPVIEANNEGGIFLDWYETSDCCFIIYIHNETDYTAHLHGTVSKGNNIDFIDKIPEDILKHLYTFCNAQN